MRRTAVALPIFLWLALGICVFAQAGTWGTVERIGDREYTLSNLLVTQQVQTPEIHGTAEVTLVNNTPTVIATFALADGEIAGGTISGTIHVTDGTDHQSLTTEVHWAAVRKASTVTIGALKSANTLEAKAVSGGTLVTAGGTNGWTSTTTSSSLSILLDANTSLGSPTMHFHFVTFNNHDSGVTFP